VLISQTPAGPARGVKAGIIPKVTGRWGAGKFQRRKTRKQHTARGAQNTQHKGEIESRTFLFHVRGRQLHRDALRRKFQRGCPAAGRRPFGGPPPLGLQLAGQAGRRLALRGVQSNEMQLDPHAILIYTDGSCYGNPGGASGCAAVARFPDKLGRGDEDIFDFGCAESRINRMELMACIRALRWIQENEPWPGVARVQVITDSLYVRDNVARARSWKRNGWRNIYGEPIENRDLWKEFLSAQRRVRVRATFEWTAGKKTPILRRVDRAAKAAAKRGGTDVDRGYSGGQVARSMVKGAATRFPAHGQTAVVRIYRKNVMVGGENKVRFDVVAEDLLSYTASCYAYASPEMSSQLHRQHGYRVRFSGNPKYPEIVELVEEVSLPRPSRTQPP
jgi:ribonuclease HI